MGIIIIEEYREIRIKELVEEVEEDLKDKMSYYTRRSQCVRK